MHTYFRNYIMSANMNECILKAVKDNDIIRVKYLIDNGANINMMYRLDWTLLHYASVTNHFEIVQLLIEHGANINVKNYMGWTPLHFASKKGYFRIVKFLIENGANVSEVDKCGTTPLIIATKYHISNINYFDIIKILIENTANINHKDRWQEDAFTLALQGTKHLEIIEFFIEHGADINYSNESNVNKIIKLAQTENIKKYLEYLITDHLTNNSHDYLLK